MRERGVLAGASVRNQLELEVCCEKNVSVPDRAFAFLTYNQTSSHTKYLRSVFIRASSSTGTCTRFSLPIPRMVMALSKDT